MARTQRVDGKARQILLLDLSWVPDGWWRLLTGESRRGTMSVEIEGRQYDAGPGSLVVFPAGVPHRSWNGGSEPTAHLVFNAPPPAPKEPFAWPVA